MRTIKYLVVVTMILIIVAIIPLYSSNDSNDFKLSGKSNSLENIDGLLSTEDSNNIPIRIKNYNSNNPKIQKTVYLTFDDGPTANTNHLLDILEKYNFKATFFMLGPKMQQYPDVVKRISNEGHSIGLHGMTHKYKEFYKDENSPLKEMDCCNDILESIIGKRSNLIRTPYGSIPYLKSAQQKKIDEAGYKIWDWTVDSQDAIMKNPTSEKISERTINCARQQRQPIILMHDKKMSINSVEKIIEYLLDYEYKYNIL